jgi:type IV pilus assembly protein PilC
MIFIVIAAVAALRAAARSGPGRRILDRIKISLPLIGPLVRKVVIARFSRTFGTLIASGVPILEALDICRDTAGNQVMESALQKVRDSISEGGSIAEPLGESGIFDDIVVNMIDVGEETGELDKMLLKVADTYDEEVDLAVASLVSVLEPMLIVFMGVAVGLIVISLFLPLLKIVESIGSGG